MPAICLFGWKLCLVAGPVLPKFLTHKLSTLVIDQSLRWSDFWSYFWSYFWSHFMAVSIWGSSILSFPIKGFLMLLIFANVRCDGIATNALLSSPNLVRLLSPSSSPANVTVRHLGWFWLIKLWTFAYLFPPSCSDGSLRGDGRPCAVYIARV